MLDLPTYFRFLNKGLIKVASAFDAEIVDDEEDSESEVPEASSDEIELSDEQAALLARCEPLQAEGF